MKSRLKLTMGLGLFALLLTSCGGTKSGKLTVTFDTHGGSEVPPQYVAYAGKIEKPEDPTKLGYNFINWTYEGEEWSFLGYSVTEDMTLDANWDIITYTITYDLNGGSLEIENPSTYTVEDAINFVNPTKTGYIFTGWTNNGSPITSIPAGSTGNLDLVANWELGNFAVNVVINDQSLGSVTGAGSYDFGSSVTLTATPTIDNVFKGWYSDSNMTALLSDSNPYTFNLQKEGITIYAKFLTKAWNVAHGVIPSLSEDGKTITYGLYPQKRMSDSALISSLNSLTAEANGWYFYNDEYYAKITGTPYSSTSKFDDGEIIESNTEYWFRCEPITWNVLKKDDGDYFVLSNLALDTHIYSENYAGMDDGHYANNYEYSDIRAWLNGSFYNSAFTLDNSHIKTTSIDNSASTTNDSSNQYACHDTEDKVFLPSYKDYINSEYGFSTSTDVSGTRVCRATDWMRAMGGYDKAHNCWYWTRSPSSSDANRAWFVDDDGHLFSNFAEIEDNFIGVRPAITIRIV